LHDVTELFAVSMQHKKLEMICAIDRGVPALLSGDAGRLRQVLTNLIGNAVKFTETGEIVLRAAVVEEKETDVLVRFTIRDTGIGIAAKDLERLFQAFSQVDDSMSRKHGGTGLG